MSDPKFPPMPTFVPDPAAKNPSALGGTWTVSTTKGPPLEVVDWQARAEKAEARVAELEAELDAEKHKRLDLEEALEEATRRSPVWDELEQVAKDVVDLGKRVKATHATASASESHNHKFSPETKPGEGVSPSPMTPSAPRQDIGETVLDGNAGKEQQEIPSKEDCREGPSVEALGQRQDRRHAGRDGGERPAPIPRASDARQATPAQTRETSAVLLAKGWINEGKGRWHHPDFDDDTWHSFETAWEEQDNVTRPNDPLPKCPTCGRHE